MESNAQHENDYYYIYSGGLVKALPNRPRGWFGGLGIIYGSEDDHDLQREFFSPHTDYSLRPGDTIRTYYRHGTDRLLGRKELTRTHVEQRKDGVWFEGQLDLKRPVHERIYRLLEKQKLGFSTGSMGHLTERIPRGKAKEIVSWPVSELSFTPMPVERRTFGKIDLKSVLLDAALREDGLTTDDLDAWEREQEQAAERYELTYSNANAATAYAATADAVYAAAERRAAEINANLIRMRMDAIYDATMRSQEEIFRQYPELRVKYAR